MIKSNKAIKFLTSRNNIVPIIILIIGVILMLSVSGGETKKEVDFEPDTEAEEMRLENILSEIEGAGRVNVMITYMGSSEHSIAYEVESDNDETSHREDKKAVMSGSSPMVIQELYPEVKGVIVTAQGAGDLSVKRNLTEAAAAATGVGVSRVKVYKSSDAF